MDPVSDHGVVFTSETVGGGGGGVVQYCAFHDTSTLCYLLDILHVVRHPPKFELYTPLRCKLK